MTMERNHRLPVQGNRTKLIDEAIGVCDYLDHALIELGQKISPSFEGDVGDKDLAQSLKDTVAQAALEFGEREELLSFCQEAMGVRQRRQKIKRYAESTSHISGSTITPVLIQNLTDEASMMAVRATMLLHEIK